MSERQQIGGWDAQLLADLGNAIARKDVSPPPVEDGGASTPETLAECGGSASYVDQVLHSELGGHDLECRLSRPLMSSLSVGTTDTEKSEAPQTTEVSDLKTIGRRVRDLRRAEGLAQEELATMIGVSRSTIAGIETGGDRGGIETMIAIADHYKVPMDWLLDRRLPAGSPPVGKLVYRPDQIAILDYWDSFSFEEKKAFGKRLRIPMPCEAA